MNRRFVFPCVIAMEGDTIVLGQIGPPKPRHETSSAQVLTGPQAPTPDPPENIPGWFRSSEHLPGLFSEVFGRHAIW
jgi:hypothetical protein